MSAEDTTLTTTNAAGEPVVVPVPKGTAVNLHSIALHYNRALLLQFAVHWADDAHRSCI